MIDYKKIEGTIHCLTGLRVGSSKDSIGIAETDSPVIRDPFTHLPYIPGSSIKGKLRSLLEVDRHQYTDEGKPCDCGNCSICQLFGCGSVRNTKKPTRLIFRDAFVTAESRIKLEQLGDSAFVEEKSETAIDRRTGTAKTGSLRTGERVPAGTEFDFSFTIRFFDEDKPHKSEFYKTLADAFEMLKKDYLGGCGTRGYGQVEISAEDGQSMAEYLKSLN